MSNVIMYELWFSQSENSYAFFEKGSTNNYNLLEKDAKLIWSVEASSWEEAQSKKHEFLGWEPYIPME